MMQKLGIETEHGPVGAPAIWRALDEGRATTRTEVGVVMEVDAQRRAGAGTCFWMKAKGVDRYRSCLRTRIEGVALTRRRTLPEIYTAGSRVRICSVDARTREGQRHSVVVEVRLSPP